MDRVGAIFYNPTEILKCRAQVSREGVQYRTIIAEILETEGTMGFYRGFAPLVLRDVPAWGAYFWAYEFLKVKTGIAKTENDGSPLTKQQLAMKVVCGGLSGQFSWIVSYPFDIIKTTI
mgnify:CR=1 FL=1